MSTHPRGSYKKDRNGARNANTAKQSGKLTMLVPNQVWASLSPIQTLASQNWYKYIYKKSKHPFKISICQLSQKDNHHTFLIPVNYLLLFIHFSIFTSWKQIFKCHESESGTESMSVDGSWFLLWQAGNGQRVMRKFNISVLTLWRDRILDKL